MVDPFYHKIAIDLIELWKVVIHGNELTFIQTNCTCQPNAVNKTNQREKTKTKRQTKTESTQIYLLTRPNKNFDVNGYKSIAITSHRQTKHYVNWWQEENPPFSGIRMTVDWWKPLVIWTLQTAVNFRWSFSTNALRSMAPVPATKSHSHTHTLTLMRS